MIAIEIAGSNRNLHFAPLDRVLRGQLDFTKIAEPSARMKSDRWPGPIPGMRLELDAKNGIGWLVDPLHDESNKAFREVIEQSGKRLGLDREEFQGIHVASWMDRMQKAVACGAAQLVEGKFPDIIPGKPIERFLTMDAETIEDKQTAVFDRLATVLDKLAMVLAKEWE